MSMAKATVAKVGEPKAGGASGLLRKGRGVEAETELEAAESGPARIYPIDLNRVPLYPPGGPSARPVGWPGFANALPPMGRLATTRGVLHAKLEVGSVDDPLEQEADDVAEKVLRMPDPAAAAGAPEEPPGLPVTPSGARVSRKCAACKEEEEEKGGQVQRRAAPGVSAGMAEAPPIVEQALRSQGRALDEETRAYFESRLRFDLSKVRVHTDARAAESARAVNALAYTVGQDIVFGQGRYAPGEREGKRLLAHELAHVAQQSAVARPMARPVAVSSAATQVARETGPGLSRDKGAGNVVRRTPPTAAPAFGKGQPARIKEPTELAEEPDGKSNVNVLGKGKLLKRDTLVEVTGVVSANGWFPIVVKEGEFIDKSGHVMPGYLKSPDDVTAAKDPPKAGEKKGEPTGNGRGSPAPASLSAPGYATTTVEGNGTSGGTQLLDKVGGINVLGGATGLAKGTLVRLDDDLGANVFHLVVVDEKSPHKDKSGVVTGDWLKPAAAPAPAANEKQNEKDADPAGAAPASPQSAPTPQQRVAAAQKLLEIARAKAQQEPKDTPKAIEILDKMKQFFDEIASDGNVATYLAQNGDLDPDHVKERVRNAKGSPGYLAGKLRDGGTTDKDWTDAIGFVTLAKTHLEALAAIGQKNSAKRKLQGEQYKYLKGTFEPAAKEIATQMLNGFKQSLLDQQNRYQDPANVNDLINALGKTQIKAKFAAARGKDAEANLDPGETRVKTRPDGNPVNPAAQAKLDEAAAVRNEGVAEVGKVAGTHPLVSFTDFPTEALAMAEGPAAVKSIIDDYIAKHLAHIETARGEIAEDINRIYKLDKLLKEAYGRLKIDGGSPQDEAVKARKQELEGQAALGDLAFNLFALMFTIMTWGAGGLVIKAAHAAIAVKMAVDARDEQKEGAAAFGAGLSPVEPSEAWAVIACLLAGIEVLSVLPKILPAVRAFNQGTDATMFLAELRKQGASEEMIKVISELTGPGKEAQRVWFGKLYERMGGNAEKLQQMLKGRRLSEMTAAEIEALVARTNQGFEQAAGELRQALGKSFSFTDPAVYDALVKMAKEGIRTKFIQLEKFIEELKPIRAKAGLPDMTPPELAKVKEAWEQAKLLEGSAEKPVQILSDKGRVIGNFSKGSQLEILPGKSKTKLYGGNTVKLDPEATTTVSGSLNDVNTLAKRGERMPGVTLQGENPGGLNILRSPKWDEIINKHLPILAAGDEAKYWKLVKDEFWETANKPWLDEAIARGDKFRFVSNPADEAAIYSTNSAGDFILENGQKTKSIFGREVDYLKANGYEFLPDGTAVKKAN